MKLVFVYNAEAGLLNGIMDSIHKVVSPSTYTCDLCAITYGLTTMNSEWRAWLEQLDMPAQFFHRADFRKAWPDANMRLPAILMEKDDRLTTLVAADAFEGIKHVDQLIAVLEEKLAEAGHDHKAL